MTINTTRTEFISEIWPPKNGEHYQVPILPIMFVPIGTRLNILPPMGNDIVWATVIDGPLTGCTVIIPNGTVLNRHDDLEQEPFDNQNPF